MAVRPPKLLAPKSAENPFQAALDHEFRAEAAAVHGRLLQRLEKALARLQACAPDDAAGRARLTARAGEALWHLQIQRELMGFRNTDALIADLNIPAAVRLAVGVRKGSQAGGTDNAIR